MGFCLKPKWLNATSIGAEISLPGLACALRARVAMALFGTWRELTQFHDIRDILLHFNVSPAHWGAFTANVGDFGNGLRLLAAFPRTGLLAGVTQTVFPDGSALNPVQATQIGLGRRLARRIRKLWEASAKLLGVSGKLLRVFGKLLGVSGKLLGDARKLPGVFGKLLGVSGKLLGVSGKLLGDARKLLGVFGKLLEFLGSFRESLGSFWETLGSFWESLASFWEFLGSFWETLGFRV
eukprot:s1267_g10.t1